ncbi:hypothetical protein BV898_17290 [Hypsibius exemplaris]|uniref:GLTSCR protein conserved domain-containing protein n=1 Tax=Hypsibius exemplaris TaxID=2072580 RepID=A0A9X6RLW2_HYPEX|nr:hypothetical protein BV898_17290 [Hypsibius exemplaris]
MGPYLLLPYLDGIRMRFANTDYRVMMVLIVKLESRCSVALLPMEAPIPAAGPDAVVASPVPESILAPAPAPAPADPPPPPPPPPPSPPPAKTSILIPNGVVEETSIKKAPPPKRPKKAPVAKPLLDNAADGAVVKPSPPKRKASPRPSRSKAKPTTTAAAAATGGVPTSAVTFYSTNNDQQQQQLQPQMIQGNFNISNFNPGSFSFVQAQPRPAGPPQQQIQQQLQQQQHLQHQQQPVLIQPQGPAQRGARVLLPKPASGSQNIRPAVSAVQTVVPKPQNNSSNSAQIPNGTIMVGGGQQPQQQQFVSFQQPPNGQLQQLSTTPGTAGKNTIVSVAPPPGQPQMVVMNQQQQQFQPPPPPGVQNLLQLSNGGQIIQTQQGGKMVFSVAPQQSTAPTQLMVTGPNGNQLLANQTVVQPGGATQGQQQQQQGQQGTLQVRLQVVQTPNGPMTLAFFPDQSGSFNTTPIGIPQQRLPGPPQQNQPMNSVAQNGITPGFTFLPQQQQQRQQPPGNFISVSALAAQASAQQQQPPPPPPVTNTEPSVSSLTNGPTGQNIPPASTTVGADGKKKRVRKKKETPSVKQVHKVEYRISSENKNFKKVEEILKSYAEEKSRNILVDALPSAPFLLSTPTAAPLIPVMMAAAAAAPPALVLPPVSYPVVPLSATSTTTTSVAVTPKKAAPPRKPAQRKPRVPVQPPPVPVVVVPPRPLTPPPPSPPPAPPPKPKTDLAERYDKDEAFFEKLPMKPFKGMNSAVNRLLPFHLLAEPDESLELLDREARAFHHVAQSFVERESALYARLSQHIVSNAAEPISKLDILSCSSTWLDMEREEFEAEKCAAAADIERRPPVWVYNPDLKLDPAVPYHDGNPLLGFTEPPPPDPEPSPPAPLPPPLSPLSGLSSTLPIPDLASSLEPPSLFAPLPSVSVVGASSEPGKLKLRIKRTLPASTNATFTSPEAPLKKKLSLKFKMSARAGWVVGAAPTPLGQHSVRTGWVVGTTPTPLGQEPGVTDRTAEEEPIASPQHTLTSPQPEGPMEDVITRSAVDSILHAEDASFGGSVKKQQQQHQLRQTTLPVMTHMTNGGGGMQQPQDAGGHTGQDYFYGSNHFGEADIDSALDEAINSILGT